MRSKRGHNLCQRFQQLIDLLSRLDLLRKQFAADKDAAAKLLTVGESKRDEKLDATEHAAMTGLCQLILNLDEAISKE